MPSDEDETTRQLRLATAGFDCVFSNDLQGARDIFTKGDSPFHMLGLGVCAFLEAALGMESGLMAEAQRSLAQCEAATKKLVKSSKSAKTSTSFPPGTEWELLHSDAVILLGMTHALSESYMGYLQCLYAMNSAHSKFTKLYKTVYSDGIDAYATPAGSASSSRTPSLYSSDASSIASSASNSTVQLPSAHKPVVKSGFLSRFGSSSTLSVPSSPARSTTPVVAPPGSLDELVLSGTAFGYGLFNLVFSLLPAKIRGVVGFFGFTHDRKLAIQALAVSAAKTDVHAVFAGLSLMTYYGVVLLLAGYQADEAHIVKRYRAIVDKLSSRYPTGSLWILNQAKILRMTYDPEGAIKVLKDGLEKPDRPSTFVQADGLLIFELAWTLLSQRRYEEAAENFIRITTINSWSHGTYYFLVAGCYIALQNYDKAQEVLDKLPDMLDKKKIGGKDLPTEVFIRKKLDFYREKQKRWNGPAANYARCMRISPAEELGIFWNTHARITRDVALQHITDLGSLTPPLTIQSTYLPPSPSKTEGPDDLDTPDELAVRALLLGILHRTIGEYEVSREFLTDAHRRQGAVKVSTWVGGVAMFELAVLDLKEAERKYGGQRDEGVSMEGEVTEMRTETEVRTETQGGVRVERASTVETTVTVSVKGKERGDADAWAKVLKGANEKLDKALALATQQVDLSSRLDSRIAMLRDEIATKKEMLAETV